MQLPESLQLQSQNHNGQCGHDELLDVPQVATCKDDTNLCCSKDAHAGEIYHDAIAEDTSLHRTSNVGQIDQ